MNGSNIGKRHINPTLVNRPKIVPAACWEHSFSRCLFMICLPLQCCCILDKCPCFVPAAPVLLWWPQCSALFDSPSVAECIWPLSSQFINPLALETKTGTKWTRAAKSGRLKGSQCNSTLFFIIQRFLHIKCDMKTCFFMHVVQCITEFVTTDHYNLQTINISLPLLGTVSPGFAAHCS